MAKCWSCGEEIEFRYVDGSVAPIHVSGPWCPARFGSDRRATVYSDVCHRTECPECHEEVYFIRHNGGCVWVDPPLGKPWNKHPCMYNDLVSGPAWVRYLEREAGLGGDRTPFFGVVILAKWLGEENEGTIRTILAIEGESERGCLAIEIMNDGQKLVRECVVVDIEGRRVIAGNGSTYTIIPVRVDSGDFDLPKDWDTQNWYGKLPFSSR